MYCTACGHANSGIARFCEICGAPMEDETTAAAPATTTGLKSTMGGFASVEPDPAASGMKSTMGGVASVFYGKPAGGYTDGVHVDGYVEKIGITPEDTAEEEDDDEYEYVDASKGRLKKAIIITILLAVVAGVSAFFYFKNSGPETVITNYYNALGAGDADGVYSCTVNSHVFDDGEITESDLRKAVTIDTDVQYADMKQQYGSDFALTIDVKQVDEYDEGDISKIAAYAEKHYGVPASSIEDVRTFLVRRDIKGSKDHDNVTQDIVVAKIDGTWYVGIRGPQSSLLKRSQIDKILGRVTKVVGKGEAVSGAYIK